MVSRVIEGTFLIVIIGLVLSNPTAFSTAAKAVSSLYVDSVGALSRVA